MDVEVLARLGEARLYEVLWHPSSQEILSILLSGDGILLDAIGNIEGWDLRLLFPTRDGVSRTHDSCKHHGVDFEIRTVCQLSDPSTGEAFDLTQSQYETLTTAFDAGYYELPRRTTLQELASGLGVSHQALSEQVRRGHGSLISSTLLSGTRSPATGL